MYFKKSLSLCIFLCATMMVMAQFQRYNPTVIAEGSQLDLAFVGGLIAPEFSAVDLNNDGVLDLYVFDKAGNVSLTFINNGTPNEVDYSYAPFYEQFFPQLSDFNQQNAFWVMLRDYNGDGIQDLFSYSDAPGIDGLIAYRGKYVNNVLNFERYDFTHIIANNTIPFPAGNGFTQIFVTGQDYPAIDDIDGDGDLDILTFAVGGGHVYLFENKSVEMGYGLDSLIYDLEDDCWGRFYESGINEFIDLSDDINVCSNGFHDPNAENEARHVGSTLLTFDNDQDGDKEILLGDISFNNLNLLSNSGDEELAFMTEQDIIFPSYNVPVEVNIFPASFYLDVNNDGVKDLLASPNVWKPGENHEVVWRYQNNGANDLPDFQFLEKDFLVDEMIDMGKEAHPTFVDFNADGLMDLVVGNSTFYRPFGERAARIYLFENTGTASNPSFELVDDDWLNFSIFDATGNNSPSPTFGDIDNDGDMDVLIGAESGGFYFGENIAGSGNVIDIPTIQFGYMGLDLGTHSKPQFIDLNRDGKLDIVSGEKVGRLVYFQNDGTSENPMFVPNIDSQTPAGNNIISIGLVDTRFGWTAGYASPNFIDFNGEWGLFAGSEKGHILKYSNIDNNLDGAFTLDNDYFGETRPGYRTYPALYDINNDGVLEMFVGNTRGGLTAYKTNVMTDGSTVSNEEISSSTELNIFPNPASNYVNLEIGSDNFSEAKIVVYNAIGQLVHQEVTANMLTRISTQNWGTGLFVVQVKIGEETFTNKLIVGK